MGIQNKYHKETRGNKLILLPTFGAIALTSALVVGAVPGSFATDCTADSCSDTTTVTVTVGAVISVGVTDINFSLDAPSPSGSFATGTGTVQVKTNDKSGYSVYLTSNDSTTYMSHESVASAKIESIETTQVLTAEKTMFDNASTKSTWGWSKDGSTYYPIMPVGTKSTESVPTIFRKTNAPSTAGDNSTLTVGVTGNSFLTSGVYTGTLLLTAVPNSNTTAISNYE